MARAISTICICATLRLENFVGLLLHAAVVYQPALFQLLADKNVLGDAHIQNRIKLLVDHCNAVAQRLAGRGDLDFLAVQQDRALVLLVNSHQDFHQRGFTCAILAEQRVDLAFFDFQMNIVQNSVAGETLCDISHFENVFTHGRLLSAVFHFPSGRRGFRTAAPEG